MYKYKASLDNVSKGLTAGITIFAIIACVIGLLVWFHVITVYNKGHLMTHGETAILLCVSVLLLVLICVMYLYQPIGYEIDETGVRIHRRINVYPIPFDTISHISTIDNMGLPVRLLGNGGLFGYTGWFYNGQFGRMRWYATQRRNYILITLLSNKKIVITPDEPVEFIDRFNKVMVKGK